MPSPPPRTIGRYQIVQEIGRGSMGVVYLAQDPLIGRLLALKTFFGHMVQAEDLLEFRQRFLREAQSAGGLSHPGIVTIHDVVELPDGATAIAMEYVHGTNLKEVLAEQSPLSLPRIADIASQVAEALDYAHARGVIHRDIKPANILLNGEGRVKITDFGIARMNTSNLTYDGQLLGTPNYMAPEQVRGEDVDHRADIFSLGVVLYEMATGAKPFPGDSLTSVTHRIAYGAFTPLADHDRSLPPAIEAVIDKALEKDPGARFSSARQLSEALLQTIESSPSAAAAWTSPPLAGEETGTASDLNETQVVPAATSGPAGASGPRPESQGRFSLPRLATLVGVAGVSVLLLAGLLWAFLHQGPDSSSNEQGRDVTAQYLRLVRQGQRLLAEGRPEAAAEVLRDAEHLAPERETARLLRERAEREADAADLRAQAENEVGRQLGLARQALASGRPSAAAAAAAAALGVDPDNAEARDLLERARAARGRESPREAAPAPAEKGSATGAQEAATVAPPTVASGPARLEVFFQSAQPTGIVVVMVGEQQVLRERFRFYGKKGLFGLIKAEPYEGQLHGGPVAIEPGAKRVRAWVTVPGKPAEVVELDGNFPGGTRRRLDLSFSAAGELTAHLE